jgi:hypothetical protein
MYKVIVEFYQANILSINGDDPKVAAQNVRKLFEQGKGKPQINRIEVFLEGQNVEIELPIHTLKLR